MAQKATGCRRQTIRIKSKRGKVIAEFMGRKGKGCGPRPKPKTGHLRVYQQALAHAARSCKRKNLKRDAFLGCVSSAMPK